MYVEEQTIHTFETTNCKQAIVSKHLQRGNLGTNLHGIKSHIPLCSITNITRNNKS